MRAAHTSAEDSPNVRPRSRRRSRAQPSAEQPLRLERLEHAQVDWHELDAFADRNVYQTRGWLSFIASTQQAEPS